MRLLALSVAVLPLVLSACAAVPPPRPEEGVVRVYGERRVVGPYVSPNAYEHFLRAELATLAGHPDDAVDELRRAIAADGVSPYLRARLAEELMALGRLDEAGDALQAALRLDPTFAEAYLDLGRVQIALGDTAAAERSLRHAVVIDRTLEDAYVALGDLYRERGDEARADDVYRTLGARVPRSVPAHHHLARAALRRGDLALAERELRRTLELDPGHVDACHDLGELLLADDRVELAVRALETCFLRTGGDVGLAGALAAAESAAGRSDAAQLVLDHLAEAAGPPSRRLAVGWLLVEHREDARALALVDGIVAAEPTLRDDAGVLLLRGAALADLGRADEAAAELARVPPTATEFVRAQVRLGALLGDEGRFPEAVASLARALPFAERFSDGEALDEALARQHERAGDRDAAVRVLRRALATHPTSARLTYALGGVLDRAGAWEQAVAAVRPMLRRRPETAEAMRFIGAVLLSHDARLDEAQKLLESALGMRPVSGEVSDLLGSLYLKLGRVADAERCLSRAGRLLADDPGVQSHLAALWLKKGERGRALEAYRRALGGHPDGSLRHAVEEQLLLLEDHRLGSR